MKLSLYDILTKLIPGSLILFVILQYTKVEWNADYTLIFTIGGYIVGFLNDAASSWMEKIYFWSWGGKPSTNQLSGKYILKVRLFDFEKVRSFLIEDTTSKDPSENELFRTALRYALSADPNRVDDFINSYVFSRNVLTSFIICCIFLIITFDQNFIYLVLCAIAIVISWQRAKESAHYYSREVFETYLRLKKPIEK
jgi:hypothetical protein